MSNPINVSAKIREAELFRSSPLGVVSKALKDTARTHHIASRMSTQPGYHMSDANWQYCYAHSCHNAFVALVRARVYGPREVEIYRRRRAKFLAKHGMSA